MKFDNTPQLVKPNKGIRAEDSEWQEHIKNPYLFNGVTAIKISATLAFGAACLGLTPPFIAPIAALTYIGSSIFQSVQESKARTQANIAAAHNSSIPPEKDSLGITFLENLFKLLTIIKQNPKKSPHPTNEM